MAPSKIILVPLNLQAKGFKANTKKKLKVKILLFLNAMSKELYNLFKVTLKYFWSMGGRDSIYSWEGDSLFFLDMDIYSIYIGPSWPT